MDTLTIRDTNNTDADLATDNQVEAHDKTSSDLTADQATDGQVVEAQGKAIDEQAAEVQDVSELTPVVDLSCNTLNKVVEHDAVSAQKKRIKLIDSECIIMGEELEINLAQQLLKKQFPRVYIYTASK